MDNQSRSAAIRRETGTCYHCGTICPAAAPAVEDKFFCCEGCKTVYTILSGNGLCRYYDLNQQPGLRQDKPEFPGRFGFLDQPEIAPRFIRFESEDTLHLE